MRGFGGLLLLLLLLLEDVPAAVALLLLLPTLKELDDIPPPVDPLLNPLIPSILIPDIVTLPPLMTTQLLFNVIFKGGRTGGLSGSIISAHGQTVLLVHEDNRTVPLETVQGAPPNKGSEVTTYTSGCSPLLLHVAKQRPLATNCPMHGHGVVLTHDVVARLLPLATGQGVPSPTDGVVITYTSGITPSPEEAQLPVQSPAATYDPTQSTGHTALFWHARTPVRKNPSSNSHA
jgi:hypothetical protein